MWYLGDHVTFQTTGTAVIPADPRLSMYDCDPCENEDGDVSGVAFVRFEWPSDAGDYATYLKDRLAPIIEPRQVFCI